MIYQIHSNKYKEEAKLGIQRNMPQIQHRRISQKNKQIKWKQAIYQIQSSKEWLWSSGQDGGVSRHTVPPPTTKRRTTTI